MRYVAYAVVLGRLSATVKMMMGCTRYAGYVWEEDQGTRGSRGERSGPWLAARPDHPFDAPGAQAVPKT